MLCTKRVPSLVIVHAFVMPINSEPFCLADAAEFHQQVLCIGVFLLDSKHVLKPRCIEHDAHWESRCVELLSLGNTMLLLECAKQSVILRGLVKMRAFVQQSVVLQRLCKQHRVLDQGSHRLVLQVLKPWLHDFDLLKPLRRKQILYLRCLNLLLDPHQIFLSRDQQMVIVTYAVKISHHNVGFEHQDPFVVELDRVVFGVLQTHQMAGRLVKQLPDLDDELGNGLK
jgi:hypothetical protein